MPLKIIFYGDSILTGCDTSGSTEITVGNGTNHIYGTGEIDWKIEKPPVSPYTPAWPEMVKQKLERFYNNTKIIKVNRSSCSTDSTGGLKAIDINVSDENPDLVIIGFGGNECNIDPKLYRQNIEGMIKRIRLKNPATEILLLSTIVLNFEICDFRINKLKEFEQELCAIRENYSGIGVVQINSLFNCINDELGKKYFDYTYNNINHPNDFGVSVLAQAVLTALGI
jgi:lysophospholipase L1-like esterase